MSNKYKHGKYRISIADDKNIQNKVVSIIDDKGNDALGGGGLKPTLVDTTEYPTLEDFLASDGKEGNLYLYPNGEKTGTNRYREYIWVKDLERYELLDEITIDLSPYALQTAVDALAALVSLKESSANKVTLLSQNSTDEQYPSAKATYEATNTVVVTTMPATGMKPNVLYKLGSLTGNIAFVLDTTGDANVVNHYYWMFDTGATAPTVTWPIAISGWASDIAPTINKNSHYEISVIDGIATYIEA